MKKKKQEKHKNRSAIKGVLSVTKYGYGFIDTDKKNGFFVKEKNMGGAFSGDLVEAVPIRGNQKREYKISTYPILFDSLYHRFLFDIIYSHQKDSNKKPNHL